MIDESKVKTIYLISNSDKKIVCRKLYLKG